MTLPTDDVPSSLELLHILGTGSYGAVYAANFTRPEHAQPQPVAAKAVPVGQAEDGEALSSELRSEMKMLKQCDSACHSA